MPRKVPKMLPTACRKCLSHHWPWSLSGSVMLVSGDGKMAVQVGMEIALFGPGLVEDDFVSCLMVFQ